MKNKTREASVGLDGIDAATVNLEVEAADVNEDKMSKNDMEKLDNELIATYDPISITFLVVPQSNEHHTLREKFVVAFD